MNYPEVAKQLFDSYAADYQHKFNENPVAVYQRAQVHDLLRPYLANARFLLDVGCGPGSDFALYKEYPGLTLHAIDPSERMMQLAINKALAIDLEIHLHAVSLDQFKTRQHFDLILLNFGVINTFPALYPIAKKLDELLADQGYLVLTIMPPFHLFSGLGDLWSGHFARFSARTYHKKVTIAKGFEVHYYDDDDLSRCFRILRKVKLGPLLPTPEQYENSGIYRNLFDKLRNFDLRFGQRLPDFWGGDHVCYVCQKMTF